jgi:predicted DNA-binding transcriptional regulator YafY
MSFEKAEDLLELARMAAAQRLGITLEDVIARFRCTKRTAQRMFRILEHLFTDTETRFDEGGRKRWSLPPGAMKELDSVTSEEFAALDLAITYLGDSFQATQLRALKEKIRRAVPRATVRRLEPDIEALLEAQGFAARPGPRPRAEPGVMVEVSKAIKACCVLEILYQGRADAKAKRRKIAPLGIMIGLRRYVVAKDVADTAGTPRSFRIDAIRTARATAESFERPEDFDLQEFANRAFGTYQNDKEFGEVVWRFAPEAAANARDFEFHPDQTLEDQPDGSLIVRFKAAGRLEMCWHLYAWGDKVEVLAPEGLRGMVEGFKRSDFPALP